MTSRRLSAGLKVLLVSTAVAFPLSWFMNATDWHWLAWPFAAIVLAAFYRAVMRARLLDGAAANLPSDREQSKTPV
jgi:hypothetical protein